VGFRAYHDPSGFDVAVPAGWRTSASGLSTFFRDPAGRSYLQIDRTTRPKPDPLPDWQAAEANAPARFPGYRRIRLERVEYRGWNTVDWEFNWTAPAGPLHVINRNVRVDDHHAYALYWSVPTAEWSQRWAAFGVVAQTFRPAS
jgi:hypothetical protein